MTFTKNDLYHNDNIWTTNYSTNDPKVTCEPDKTLLARKEGCEMLYFVKKLAENGIGQSRLWLAAIKKLNVEFWNMFRAM